MPEIMKKTVVILSLLLLILVSCSEKNPAFYNQVLGNFDKHSYFIALDIRSDEFKGRVLVENNNLFTFLNKTNGWDKERYKSMMKRILIHRRIMKIKNTADLSLSFIKVKEINKVYLSANKGPDSFIKDYFNGKIFKYETPEDEIYAVINQLFYWKIPIKFDDATGQFMLDE
jgi:hypothetical protein